MMLKETGNNKKIVMIALSILIGMSLTIFPLPKAMVWIRPEWLLLLAVFWLIWVPQKFGVISAFLLGLFWDLLVGTVLGLHAMLLTIMAYVCLRFNIQLRSLPVWQQTIFITTLVLFELMIKYWVLTLVGSSPDTWKYWLPVFSTALIWPWFFGGLQLYQQRYVSS